MSVHLPELAFVAWSVCLVVKKYCTGYPSHLPQIYYEKLHHQVVNFLLCTHLALALTYNDYASIKESDGCHDTGVVSIKCVQ